METEFEKSYITEFAGREELGGGRKSYENAVDFIESFGAKEILAVIDVNLALKAKSTDFMVIGKTKANPNSLTALSDELAKYIPMHDSSMIEAWKNGDETERKAYEKRKNYPDAYKNINVTGSYAVATILQVAMFEAGKKNITKISAQYHMKHPKNPSMSEPELSEYKSPATAKIAIEKAQKFKTAKPYWIDLLPKVVHMVNEAYAWKEAQLKREEAAAKKPSA